MTRSMNTKPVRSSAYHLVFRVTKTDCRLKCFCGALVVSTSRRDCILLLILLAFWGVHGHGLLVLPLAGDEILTGPVRTFQTIKELRKSCRVLSWDGLTSFTSASYFWKFPQLLTFSFSPSLFFLLTSELGHVPALASALEDEAAVSRETFPALAGECRAWSMPRFSPPHFPTPAPSGRRWCRQEPGRGPPRPRPNCFFDRPTRDGRLPGESSSPRSISRRE